MYIAGKGHEHQGPGTSLTLFSPPNYRVKAGLSGCKGTGCTKGMGGCACAGGLGLFEAGTDFTQWSWPEWAIVGIAGYMVFSTLFTTRTAAARVGEGYRRTRRKIGKRIAG